MTRIAILGSTGSVGQQAIDVIMHSQDFEVVGLAASKNWRQVLDQARLLNATKVALYSEEAAHVANREKKYMGLQEVEILSGSEGLCYISSLPECDLIIHAIPGFQGVKPLLSSLESGKRVALSGKEALVCAGELVKPFLLSDPHSIIPVDSEHSAIFQCLIGEDRRAVEYIILTASGGALRDLGAEELSRIEPSDALQHPTWQMGPKVTIDSATLFNKTLEVMEAHYLFNVPYEKIKVLIHRESIVHSMVSFMDGSVKAQLGKPDMRLPIAFALNFPERKKGPVPTIDLASTKLTFEEPDLERFPCLELGYEAGKMGGTAPCVLSVSDEIVVEQFLKGRISFTQIYNILKSVLDRSEIQIVDSVETLERAAERAKIETEKTIDMITRR
ncbi:MAG TPA: 1-deoxy-D-xylulose-5-phosphate reductoisomerase [Bacillota bacterium]|nr:1-deoxy-D-xylulose-5-phosphate reductoisomerase [Candidatus Fermentithermobacillaceae bacterium]HOK63851.1 1-deoxy-D-xylulose-5-phosphate reductoisomerase [Bacillota bacterium]HOL11461.1 1-deoxy-D-xylulose-5-phosphate reductoisomerase [Bacillota bacterium]HPP61290.1 1-deoxy-D-xylulose-5-phosphate reductoisomerase [Bacillota bacterium]